MRDCNQGRFLQRIRFLRRQFLQDGGLPFTNVLSAKTVEQALAAVGPTNVAYFFLSCLRISSLVSFLGFIM